jgi:hypothetical protein
MTAIPARDLRNHTAEVLRRVEAGEEIEVLSELVRLGPDTTGLAEELQATLIDTTDDLPW